MFIRLKKTLFLMILSLLIIILAYQFVNGETVFSSAQKSLRIPVIMYHQISKDGKNVGKYVISEKELEKDLIFLHENGYETVNVSDLVSFVEDKMDLPDKCIMLTFDDGYETGYTVLYPMLKKYNMKAVVSVIGSLTEFYTENEDHNDRYSYLNRDEIEFLSQTDEIEIQNHSFNMHYCEKGKRKGIKKIYGESYEEYKNSLNSDIGKMQEYLLKTTGRLPEAMVYPYGEYCSETLEICKNLGFKSTMTCEEMINTVTRFQPDSLYNLGRFNRSGLVDREQFFSKIIS